jgi:hypothetical protein
MPLQRLEPYGSKDPRPVLRGLSAGNCAQLPYFDYGSFVEGNFAVRYVSLRLCMLQFAIRFRL